MSVVESSRNTKAKLTYGIEPYDVIIVGGGPAGSTCAYYLVRHGLKTLILDKAEFPRVKLCAGWITPHVWKYVGIKPEDYPLGIWKFNHVNLHFRKKNYKKAARGYFIRRREFDEFLIRRSKAVVVEGHHVRKIIQDQNNYWIVDGKFKARHLIGAGGTHCPVARTIFPKNKKPLCGTQEKEFRSKKDEISKCRIGEDGEPHILLHNDMRGYSWNVPKTEWINIGSGTKMAVEVKSAWQKARAFFESEGTIPATSGLVLDKMKGHGYSSYSLQNLQHSQKENVFLIGDALGLAQPLTGEGILPAVLSGKLCAHAIITDDPLSYRKSLNSHPIFKDYRILASLQRLSSKIWKRKNATSKKGSRLLNDFIVSTFVSLFSGKRSMLRRLIAFLIYH